ncbi:hypothetical protein CI610_01287 [invertebrate metagenome]|uniref:Uncharacterized protein n=1 Tax=invertebrate metagenome TaxID=1711999 RepID=A0A2H9T8Y4_9ZZZZ
MSFYASYYVQDKKKSPTVTTTEFAGSSPPAPHITQEQISHIRSLLNSDYPVEEYLLTEALNQTTVADLKQILERKNRQSIQNLQMLIQGIQQSLSASQKPVSVDPTLRQQKTVPTIPPENFDQAHHASSTRSPYPPIVYPESNPAKPAAHNLPPLIYPHPPQGCPNLSDQNNTNTQNLQVEQYTSAHDVYSALPCKQLPEKLRDKYDASQLIYKGETITVIGLCSKDPSQPAAVLKFVALPDTDNNDILPEHIKISLRQALQQHRDRRNQQKNLNSILPDVFNPIEEQGEYTVQLDGTTEQTLQDIISSKRIQNLGIEDTLLCGISLTVSWHTEPWGAPLDLTNRYKTTEGNHLLQKDMYHIINACLEALEYQQIMLRDITPDQFLLMPDGYIKIVVNQNTVRTVQTCDDNITSIRESDLMLTTRQMAGKGTDPIENTWQKLTCLITWLTLGKHPVYPIYKEMFLLENKDCNVVNEITEQQAQELWNDYLKTVKKNKDTSLTQYALEQSGADPQLIEFIVFLHSHAYCSQEKDFPTLRIMYEHPYLKDPSTLMTSGQLQRNTPLPPIQYPAH